MHCAAQKHIYYPNSKYFAEMGVQFWEGHYRAVCCVIQIQRQSEKNELHLRLSIALRGSAKRSAIPLKRASSRDVGRPEHEQLSPAGTQTCVVVCSGPLPCPATESARKYSRPPEHSSVLVDLVRALQPEEARKYLRPAEKNSRMCHENAFGT